MRAIGPSKWIRLLTLLTPEGDEQRNHLANLIDEEIRYSIEMLSIWLASEDLDPDLIRLDARLLDVDSPFIALNRSIQIFLTTREDNGEIDVMIAQSQHQIDRLRRRALNSGNSLSSSHLLEKLDQTLSRLIILLNIVRSPTIAKKQRYSLLLPNQMFIQSAEHHQVRHFFARNLNLLAQSVVHHKSKHGEHYITDTVSSYFKMFFSAAGAGVFIALMALIKLKLPSDTLSPLIYAILSSLNYGIGFVIVYLCACSIATKQSAMTAAYLAQTIQSHQESKGIARKIAKLLMDVNRSQSIAVVGNVSVALLLAYIIANIFLGMQFTAILPDSKVAYELKNISPIGGLSLWYAAIAALWLFCSGLIAGYFDNRADYLRLGERLYQHPIFRLLSDSKRQRFADYIHKHYGAIHGNFYFGFLLGMTPLVGNLTGLPLDIHHVAFSSTNLGYIVGSGEMHWWYFIQNLVFVLMIGMVNLWVSFTFAISLALRATNSSFPPFKSFLKTLRKEISNPLKLFFPVGLQKTNASSSDSVDK